MEIFNDGDWHFYIEESMTGLYQGSYYGSSTRVSEIGTVFDGDYHEKYIRIPDKKIELFLDEQTIQKCLDTDIPRLYYTVEFPNAYLYIRHIYKFDAYEISGLELKS
tara:strand:- start:507 stop:827 length:321 start_codon:yes stop_codon:yes gene_type:complete